MWDRFGMCVCMCVCVALEFTRAALASFWCVCVCSDPHLLVTPFQTRDTLLNKEKILLKNKFPNLLPICDRPSTLTNYAVCDQKFVRVEGGLGVERIFCESLTPASKKRVVVVTDIV